MRHLLPSAVLVGSVAGFFLPPAATTALGAPDPSRKWTHGRSACDPVGRQLVDNGGLVAVEREPLEVAWTYALGDVESLSALKCLPEAASAAGELAGRLRALEDEILPGVQATACEAAGDRRSLRLPLVKASATRMGQSAEFFEGAFDRFEAIEGKIAADVPAEGLAFDDCRAKARRGWSRARASLNRLSCEVSASLERMEAFRDRAEQVAGSAVDCVAAPVAKAALKADPAPASLAPPTVASEQGYQPFTGVDSVPQAKGLDSLGF